MAYAAATYLGGALTIYFLNNTCTGPGQSYAVANYNGTFVQLCPLQTTVLDPNTTVYWDGGLVNANDFVVTQYGYTYQNLAIAYGTCAQLLAMDPNFFTLPCGPTGSPLSLSVYPTSYTFGDAGLTLFYGGAGCGPGNAAFYSLNGGDYVSLCQGSNYINPDITVAWTGQPDWQSFTAYYQGYSYNNTPGPSVVADCNSILGAAGCITGPTAPVPPTPPTPPFGPTGQTGHTGPSWIFWVALIVGVLILLGLIGLVVYLYHK